jgi:hypothetical protein
MMQNISVHILIPSFSFCEISNDAHVRSIICLSWQRLETHRPAADSTSSVQPSFSNATEDYMQEENYV